MNEKDYLLQLRENQKKEQEKQKKSLADWKVGKDIEKSLLSSLKCPCCAGSGKALVQNRRNTEVFSVDLYRCVEVRCNSCSGTGYFRKDLLENLIQEYNKNK